MLEEAHSFKQLLPKQSYIDQNHCFEQLLPQKSNFGQNIVLRSFCLNQTILDETAVLKQLLRKYSHFDQFTEVLSSFCQDKAILAKKKHSFKQLLRK